MEDYAGSSNHFHYCSYLIKELVPLFVITALLLVAFMYMYHGQRFNEGVECNYTLFEWNMDHPTDEPILDVCMCNSDIQDNFFSYKDSLHNVFGCLAGRPDDKTEDVLDFIC
jgi:hypothetical protein